MTVAVAAPSSAADLAARPWPHALSLAVRVTAVCCLLGAEVVHAAVIDEHIMEWLPIGVFFVGLSLIEGVLAVALIITPSSSVIRLVVSVSVGTVALWLYTRTVGLPIGPWAGRVEPVGRLDTVATALELVTASVLLARPGRRVRTKS